MWGAALALTASCGGVFEAQDGGPSVAVSGTRSLSRSCEGAWTFGWSSALGSTFSPYIHYFPAASGYNGLDAWSASAQVRLEDPYGSLPAAFSNPRMNAVRVSTLTAQPGQFFLHPGPRGQYSIARWTAPRAGAYELRARFDGIDDGPAPTDVHVQHNGQDAAPAGYINVNRGGNSFSFAARLAVEGGDTIDFDVGDGGNGFKNDSTALAVSVCEAAEGGGPRGPSE